MGGVFDYLFGVAVEHCNGARNGVAFLIVFNITAGNGFEVGELEFVFLADLECELFLEDFGFGDGDHNCS